MRGESPGRLRRGRVGFGLALLAILAVACSSSSGEPTASSSAPASVESSPSLAAEPSADPAHPVGLIAIGHSGLTGEGTGASSGAVPTNSYATGTSPEVNSIYLRMVSALPETEGHVANTAQGGAHAYQLSTQAESALRQVPYPALAIVSTIDNDILCDGTDDAHIPLFGESVAEGLNVIHEASPNTQILVIGQFGRPSVDFVEGLVTAHPEAKASVTWADMCTFYDADGNLNPEGFAMLTGIIDAYEAEQARVCAEVPNCQTDGGVRAAWVDQMAYFSPDWAHLNITGQAAEAENLWPAVESVLGL